MPLNQRLAVFRGREVLSQLTSHCSNRFTVFFCVHDHVSEFLCQPTSARQHTTRDMVRSLPTYHRMCSLPYRECPLHVAPQIVSCGAAATGNMSTTLRHVLPATQPQSYPVMRDGSRGSRIRLRAVCMAELPPLVLRGLAYGELSPTSANACSSHGAAALAAAIRSLKEPRRP